MGGFNKRLFSKKYCPTKTKLIWFACSCLVWIVFTLWLMLYPVPMYFVIKWNVFAYSHNKWWTTNWLTNDWFKIPFQAPPPASLTHHKTKSPVCCVCFQRLGISRTDPASLTPQEVGNFVRLDIDPAKITWQRGMSTMHSVALPTLHHYRHLTTHKRTTSVCALVVVSQRNENNK